MNGWFVDQLKSPAKYSRRWNFLAASTIDSQSSERSAGDVLQEEMTNARHESSTIATSSIELYRNVGKSQTCEGAKFHGTPERRPLTTPYVVFAFEDDLSDMLSPNLQHVAK